MIQDVRKGTNEAWFRDLNERLEQRAAGNGHTRFEIVCECAVEECTERIEITAAAYEQVRAEPKDFIVVPGHADPACEQIVSSEEGYDVVEKFGDAGAVAEIQDPRDGESSSGESSG